jgi:outer membrane protein assembly factor BamB/tRNA A-37 threonylcarbamoyl transferase component Bud32
MTSLCPTCGETYPTRDGCRRCLLEQPTRAPAPADTSETLDAIPVAERCFEGRAVPGYEILEELGRGGMGVVYKSRHLKLNRIVALKMILSGGHAAEAEMDRFRAEAKAVARLSHPNVVQIFEVGEHDGLPYLSLEFCAGGGLDRKLSGTPQPPRQAAALVRTLAEAMQAAHDAKVIHRDLKPANVLLMSDGTPKITDFGLAKKLDEQGRTQTGAVMGTPSYMAPEQAQGRKDVGPAADTYALGAILYECLTGRPPFKAATPFDTILQVIGDEPVSPRSLVKSMPRDLETIALKCLEKNPAARYGSAAELADDLARFLADEPIEARRPALGERLWRRASKQGRQAMWTAGVGAGLALALLAAVLGWSAYRESQKGELELTTDGPSLTAEVLREDESLVTRFRVPTVDPVRLDPGVYRLRLSAPGWPSQEANLLILPGGKHAFDANILPRECWQPLEVLVRRDATGTHRPVPVLSADRTDLLLVRDNSLVRIHGKTGAQTPLVLQKPLDRGHLALPDEFRHDLDGDGNADVYLHHADGTLSLLSEKIGVVAAPGGRVLAAVPAEGKRHDLVLLVGDGELTRRTFEGKAVWRKEVWRNKGQRGNEPRAAAGAWKGRPALLVANEAQVDCFDLATGEQLAHAVVIPPSDNPPDLTPRFLPLAGPDTDVLWAPTHSDSERMSRDNLHVVLAYSPSAGRVLWSDARAVLDTPRTKAGHDVLLLTFGGGEGKGDWAAVERVLGGTGQTLWQARLVKGRDEGLRTLSLRAVAGPDVDGDGEPDVFVAWTTSTQPPEAHLHALSGKDGRTIWHRRLPADADAEFSPLLLWPGGPHGVPRLVAAREPRDPARRGSGGRRIDVFDCADGRPLHQITASDSPRVIDLDGDGVPDLIYLTYSQATKGREFEGLSDLRSRSGAGEQSTVKLRAIRGEPPTTWRWMGRWEPINDLDGDGVPEVLRRERDGSLAVASGATGRLLWPFGHLSPSGGPARGGKARLVAADTVLSLPAGEGDLDRDGVPDLIVLDPTRTAAAAQDRKVLLPIRAVSGATGKTIWTADSFESAFPIEITDGRQRVQASPPVWLVEGGEPLLLTRAAVLQARKETQRYLVMLSARSGKVKWHQESSMGPSPRSDEVSEAESKTQIVTTVAGRRLLVHLEEEKNEAPNLVVRDLLTGEALSRLRVTAKGQTPLGLAAWPGRPDLILYRVGNSLCCAALVSGAKARRGRPGVGSPHVFAGRQREEGAPPSITLTKDWQHDAAVNSNGPDWSSPVSLGRGKGRLIVYAVVPPGWVEQGGVGLIALDERGNPVARRILSADVRGFPDLHVVNLAGAETLLVVSRSRVQALRGGIDAKNDLWTWQHGQRGAETSLVDSDGPTLTFRLEGEGLVGLDGDGRPAWPDRLAGGSAHFDGDGQRCVVSWPGRQTVRQAARMPGEPVDSVGLDLPEPTDDPRHVRPLPWVLMAGQREWWPRPSFAALAVLVALLGVVLPARLYFEGMGRRSWRRLLLALVWSAAAAVAVIYLAPEVNLWLAGSPGRFEALVWRVTGLAILGLPLSQAAWSLAAALRRREGWRLGRLLLLWLACCAVVAGLLLYLERGSLDEEQYYVADGWHVVWLPGAFLLGVLLSLATVGRALWWAARPRRHSKAKKRAAPAAAAAL